MVCGPASGISKNIQFSPGVALASRMACLKEPKPPSLVLMTTNVDGSVMRSVASLFLLFVTCAPPVALLKTRRTVSMDSGSVSAKIGTEKVVCILHQRM